MAATTCSVPLSSLVADPFLLQVGDSIWANVVASNLYGDSDVSVDGNGALVALVPDAPVNLQKDAAVTSASVIRLTWSEGAANNGAPVIDYRIWYD
jgi:hypothetical protein